MLDCTFTNASSHALFNFFFFCSLFCSSLFFCSLFFCSSLFCIFLFYVLDCTFTNSISHVLFDFFFLFGLDTGFFSCFCFCLCIFLCSPFCSFCFFLFPFCFFCHLCFDIIWQYTRQCVIHICKLSSKCGVSCFYSLCFLYRINSGSIQHRISNNVGCVCFAIWCCICISPFVHL